MKIRIIGTGGVTGYAMAALNKTYRNAEITLQDKDTLEERNLDRQLFDAKSVGKNKADALNKFHGTKHKVIKEWYDGERIDADFIICAADNNRARRAIMNMMDETRSKALLLVAGNECDDAIAFAYRTEWRNNPALDPRVRFPAILTDNEGHPFRCTDEEVLAVSPQTATANMVAAGLTLWLLNAWHGWTGESRGMPYEVFQTKFNGAVKRIQK